MNADKKGKSLHNIHSTKALPSYCMSVGWVGGLEINVSMG